MSRFLRAFLRFWSDFLIGDRLELFIGPIVALAGAALLVARRAARRAGRRPVCSSLSSCRRVQRGPGNAPMTFFQAIVLGLLQGVTELFPVSSLGHSVILPAFLGWNDLVAAQDASESYFLAFLVGLHVATALALACYFRDDWRRIIGALLGLARASAGSTTPTPGSAGC